MKATKIHLIFDNLVMSGAVTLDELARFFVTFSGEMFLGFTLFATLIARASIPEVQNYIDAHPGVQKASYELFILRENLPMPARASRDTESLPQAVTGNVDVNTELLPKAVKVDDK